MKTFSFLFTLFIVTGMLSAPGVVAQSAASSATETEKQNIRNLIQKTADYNNVGNVEGWVSLFAEGAVYMPPQSESVSTTNGLISVAEAGFKHKADIEIEPLEIHVEGNWAFARSKVSGTVTLQGSGEKINIDTKQLVIYRKNAEGVWKIFRLMNNRNS